MLTVTSVMSRGDAAKRGHGIQSRLGVSRWAGKAANGLERV